MKKVLKLIANISITSGVILALFPIAYLVIISPLTQYNTVSSNDYNPKLETSIITNRLSNSENLSKGITNTASINFNQVSKINNNEYIKIPSIGIDTQFFLGNSIDTLNKGIWLMPDHGYPDSNSLPIVLAGHRWGPDNATYAYRLRNLFFNLPNIKIGDDIYINWNNVNYTYRVNFIEENTYVSRLSDLILFTCVDYTSQKRFFVYANKV